MRWQQKKPYFFSFFLFSWLVWSMQHEMCYFLSSLLGTGSCFLCLLQMFRKLIPKPAPVWHWPRCTLPHPAFILLHRSICSLFFIPLSFVHKTIHQPPPASPHVVLGGGGRARLYVSRLPRQGNGGQTSVRSRCPSIKTVFTFSLWDPIWRIYNLAAQTCCKLNLSYLVSSGVVVTVLSRIISQTWCGGSASSPHTPPGDGWRRWLCERAFLALLCFCF